MNYIDSMDQFEEYSMAYVFSKKKEAYRVSIRREKIQQRFQENRQKTCSNGIILQLDIIGSKSSSINQPSDNENSQFEIPSRLASITKEQIQSLFNRTNNQELFIQNINTQFQQILSKFQLLNYIELTNDKLDELKSYMHLVVNIEQAQNQQIIKLADISFIIRLMSVNELTVQKKLQIIDILCVLYDSNEIQQNIIQYFIQYLSTDNSYLIEKILDFFQSSLSQEQRDASTLSLKLQKPFFAKIFMRLLSLKIEKVSIRILSVVCELIENEAGRVFLNSLLDKKEIMSQLFVWHLEIKNQQIMELISKIISIMINKIDDSSESSEVFIQSLIDATFISKVFEIFSQQSREKSFFKPLIYIVFSHASHFQIEHYFNTNLKYVIMNHLTNCLVTPKQELTLLVLQFIHQLLFQEKQFNQQNYYPRRKVIQSLEINAFINEYTKDMNENISREALLIQSYL